MTSVNWHYIRQGYALLATDSLAEGHWFGGKPSQAGAECPICRIPLLLIADLDCQVFREREHARLFHELNRLPLYYCWRCAAERLSYRVVRPDKIEVLQNNGQPAGPDFPYRSYPDHFPRTPVKTVQIHYQTAKLLVIQQEIGEEWLSENDKQLLFDGLKSLRHDAFANYDINRHQIGGLVSLIQSHERIQCPNPQCRLHATYYESSNARMKELAVIHNDPCSGLPMMEALAELEESSDFNEWVQLVYWVCEECLTIAVSNRCD